MTFKTFDGPNVPRLDAPTFSRRAFLQAAASASAVASVAVPPAAAHACQAAYGAQERMMHHLMMAAQALDELVSEDDSRWVVTMGGKGPHKDRFINVDCMQSIRGLVPGFETEGLMIERSKELVRWTA
jgi:hypothetical protein